MIIYQARESCNAPILDSVGHPWLSIPARTVDASLEPILPSLLAKLHACTKLLKCKLEEKETRKEVTNKL